MLLHGIGGRLLIRRSRRALDGVLAGVIVGGSLDSSIDGAPDEPLADVNPAMRIGVSTASAIAMPITITPSTTHTIHSFDPRGLG